MSPLTGLANRLLSPLFQRGVTVFGRQAPKAAASPATGALAGFSLIPGIPGAIEAGTGLYEAAEGVLRGQNPRQIVNRMNQPGYQGVPKLGQRRADGKVWAGNDYGWQSGASAVKAGLLPSEAVGSTATGQAFGGGRTNRPGDAPPARDLPPARDTSSSVLPPQQTGSVVTPPAPALPAPVQTGPAVPGTQAGNAAAVQQAPSAIETQFQRYYQGGQMNPFFGGAPSAQAPKSAAAMEEAAMLQRAPTTMPLADYYRAQSATGRANMDQIVSAMGYTGDMEKWARANPMLAQRAYAGQFQGGVPTQGAPGAQPVVDEALNPSGPEFRGVGGNGERIYNFAADDVDAAKIKAFQDLLSKQRQ